MSMKLPTYPSPKPTLTLTSHLGQNVALVEGYVGSFLETYNDPGMPYRKWKKTTKEMLGLFVGVHFRELSVL